MNKLEKGTPFGDTVKKYVRNKWKDLLIISVLIIVLLFAISRIFASEDEEQTATMEKTETEIKICRLLEEINGVGEAEVIVCNTEEGAESVVVVCEGAKNLQVVMNVREAVAAALGIEQKSVKIYLKKG